MKNDLQGLTLLLAELLGIILTKYRLRWSRSKVLAPRPKVCGFKPGWALLKFRDIKFQRSNPPGTSPESEIPVNFHAILLLNTNLTYATLPLGEHNVCILIVLHMKMNSSVICWILQLHASNSMMAHSWPPAGNRGFPRYSWANPAWFNQKPNFLNPYCL